MTSAELVVPSKASPAPIEPGTAQRLLWKLVWLYVFGTVVAVSTTMLLVFVGLKYTAQQWVMVLLGTPLTVFFFVGPDVYLIVRHYRPIRVVLESLEAGVTPTREAVSQALVRALNLPFYSFLRVTFVHGPLAALGQIVLFHALNRWFDAGFEDWQTYTFTAMIFFFASPAHAIVEFFSLTRNMTPLLERLWPYGAGIGGCAEQPIAVRLRSKLLYLCVFITALPLLFVAFSIIFKVDQLLREVGVSVTLAMMWPLWSWIITIMVVCMVGALAMSVLTATDVSRAARRLIEGMNAVESGDLAVDLRITGTDEYADLYRGFNLMIEGLREEVRLLEVTQDLAGELHLDHLIGRIMGAATELLDADRSTVFIHDPERNELWSRYGQGLQQREIRIAANAGIAGSVFSSGRSASITDPYKDPRFNPEIDQSTGYRTTSILCMPIVNKAGKRIGVTQVLNKRSGAFTAKDEQRLLAFTAQVAVSLENAQLFDEVLAVKNYNENILASSFNGVVTLDTARRVVTANAAARRLLGLPAERLLQQPAATVFGEANAWVLASVEKTMAGAASDIAVDASLRQGDGNRAAVNLTAAPLRNAAGETIGSILTFEDITREMRVRSTMSRYMSKEVADQLLQSGETVLGGKLQKVSILFSDVRGFTTTAEALGARETVAMLNEYFETMVEIIFARQGILDKYIGDAMMALFGSPFNGPRDADNAVQVAVDMIAALRSLNARRAQDGRRPMDVGIGISTGEVIVGNIGSQRRMEYTVIGDSVNLASRLESATKQYGVKVLLSQHTVEALRESVPVREIDRLRVKGKEQPVAVYEPLAYHDEFSFPALARILPLYNEALAACRARDWRRAVAGFEAVLALHPGDRPSQLHLERCRHYGQSAPPEDWDGVWVMREK